MQDFLKEYDVTYEMRVSWTDMNAAWHVNNVTYLEYSETARIEYFNQLNFMVRIHDPNFKVGPIFSEVNCKYKAPLTYPDTITIASRINLETMDECSFWVEQIIVSHQLQKIAAEIRSRVVAYDYVKQEKAALPDYLLKQLGK